MPENTAEQLPQLDNVRDNATQEDFKMKNKVYEMLLYAYPALEQFPKSDRKLYSSCFRSCHIVFA